jgi:phospho-N-acetylmuramoyl-pentapeptide-transferase
MRVLLAAGAISLAFSLFLTPLFIRAFRKLAWGQFIRDDGPQSHHTKRGTATMGGVIIIVGTLVGFFASYLIFQEQVGVSALLVFIDDFLKVRKKQSLGLGGWAKVAGQLIVATVFAVLAINFPNTEGFTPASTNISIIRDIPINFMAIGIPVIGILLYILWTSVIVAATSNGVNVTDGLDGLATGASILAIGSYIIIGFWQFNQSCFSSSLASDVAYKCYDVRDPLDLAVVAAAIVGALIGFLWWNTSPAQIFMGDSGSLALGGALAALAILSKTELLLVLVGGLFVIEAGSVIVQRVYFKATRGKRIFLMSPIHHHFELKGWAEVTVVVRFWIIGGLLVAAGVGSFYLEWLSR